MGNTVSAAEIAATQIIHPNAPLKAPVENQFIDPARLSKEIPPECPMHQKYTSECPIQHEKGEINPLNMVM